MPAAASASASAPKESRDLGMSPGGMEEREGMTNSALSSHPSSPHKLLAPEHNPSDG